MEDDEDFVPSEEEEEEELQERRTQGGKKRKSLGDDSDESSETDDGCCGNQQNKGKKNNNNNETKKKRRVRYGWACSMCKLKHRSCDGQRPCTRCKNEGFADTCCDGSGDEGEKQQNDNKKKIKQEKLAYTTMIKHKGNMCCVTSERPLVENCKKEKKQHAQQHTPSPCSQRQLEREILAKVIEFVSLKADALTTTNNTASSIMPAFAQLLQPQQQPQQHTQQPQQHTQQPQQQHVPQDFSFQFLAPPRWHQPTPIVVEGLSTYIPPSLFPSQPQLSFASFPSNLFLRPTEGQEREREREKGVEGQGTRSETCFAFPTVTNCMPARGEPKKEGASCASVATPPLASYYGWNSTEVEGFLF